MDAFEHCSVAILAGGKSSRFGTDKGLTIFQHKPLIQHVIDIANKVSKDVLIISDDPNYQNFGIPVFNDEFKLKGPLGGLHVALKNSTNKHCFLMACDMPFLKPELFHGLFKNNHYQAVVPLHQYQPEPLCALYHSSALPSVEKHLKEGKLKMTDTIEQLNHHWYHVDENCEFYDSKMFANINTISDWENYQ